MNRKRENKAQSTVHAWMRGAYGARSACSGCEHKKVDGCVNTEKTTVGGAAERRKENGRRSKTWRKCQDDTRYLIQLIIADKRSVHTASQFTTVALSLTHLSGNFLATSVCCSSHQSMTSSLAIKRYYHAHRNLLCFHNHSDGANEATHVFPSTHTPEACSPGKLPKLS